MYSYKRIIDTDYGTLTVFIIAIESTLTADVTTRVNITNADNIYPNMSAIVSTVSSNAHTPLPNSRPNSTNVGNAKFYLNSAKTMLNVADSSNTLRYAVYFENTTTYGLVIFRDINGTCFGTTNPLLTYQTDGARVKQAATDLYFGVIDSPDYLSGTYPINASQATLDFWTNFYNETSEAPTDPYNNSGSSSDSGGGGGDGLDSVSGSDVGDPDLPELSAVSTGLLSIYTPTLSQLQSLGSFLWSDAFSLDTFKKIFSDPWEAILGLSILGVGVSGGTDTEVHIGNIDTDIYMPKLSSQYYKFNCGSITLKETWGSYLDYNPYTKVSIYLPFIGTHALNVDDIMGKTINLKYNIDVLSGACVANIQCGGTVLYSFTGSCSATIPLSGNSYTNMINGILGVATSIGSMVATGGATAPLAVPAMASSVVNGAKTDVSHSGNVSGMAGIMGVKSAYLIMEVPRICIPKNQDKYIGYPTYTTKKVGDLSGYCVFEDIKIRGNSHATMGEIEEVESIMKSGVYL